MINCESIMCKFLLFVMCCCCASAGPVFYVELCATYAGGCPAGPNLVPPSGPPVDYAAEWASFWSPSNPATGVQATVRDSANGWVVGSITGDNSIHTQFVYSPTSGMVCCVADDPFSINSITEGGQILGRAYTGGFFLSSVGSMNRFSGGGMVYPVLISPPSSPTLGQSILNSSSLYEADSAGRFYGYSASGGFVMDPNPPIPEPGTLSLVTLAGGAAVVAARLRRRKS